MTRRVVPPLPDSVTAPLTDAVQAAHQAAAVAYTADVWASFWKSTSSFGVDRGADADTLSTWIGWVFRRRLYEALVRAAPLVRTRSGDMAPNPLEQNIALLTQQIDGVRFAWEQRQARRLRDGEMAALLESAEDGGGRRTRRSP